MRLLICLLFAEVAWLVNIAPLLEAQALGKAFEHFGKGNIEGIIRACDWALSYHTYGDVEALASMLGLAQMVNGSPVVSAQDKTRMNAYMKTRLRIVDLSIR